MAKGGAPADGKPAANDTKSGQPAYQFAIKPEEKSGWEGFKSFVWNSEKSEFLGRTASSWCKYPISAFVFIPDLPKYQTRRSYHKVGWSKARNGYP